MCVDGVAPRAKMNQQRQRRFRSADELQKARQAAVERGEAVPDMEEVFDSNCITPGTEFMCQLSEHLRYFVAYKLQTDICWQNCQVIFSGQEVPGEGEHKIMEFIRNRKMQPEYDPNEVHCLYGLDADLIMLGLASHEPHFFLIREEVDFGKTKNDRDREADLKEQGLLGDTSMRGVDRLQCLHLSLLREYLALEFSSVGGGLQGPLRSIPIDLERVVDDFLLLFFLVGNDFLPTLPSLDIREGSMATLFDLYSTHFVQAGRFLTDQGQLRWPELEAMFRLLAYHEETMLEEKAANAVEFKRRLARNAEAWGAGLDVAATPTTVDSVEGFRELHYRSKLGLTDFSPGSPEVEQVKLAYIEGLQWTLTYYYQGCCSWKWFYPYYYAPMASDLADLHCHHQIMFEQGQPFEPHQQLLGVLPPTSCRLLPPPFRWLMTDPASPIADFYPTEFEVNREAGQAEWEGVVKIPFIDEDRLLAAYKGVVPQLTEAQRRTNQRGPALRCRITAEVTEPLLPAPDLDFPAVAQCRVAVEPFALSPRRFVPRLCNGVHMGAEAPEGIPTFATKSSITSRIHLVGVNVFGMPSRKESRVIQTPDVASPPSGDAVPTASSTAALIGRQVWVGWPQHRRAKVVMVADANVLLSGDRQGRRTDVLSEAERASFHKEAEYHRNILTQRLALETGTVHVLVYVRWLAHFARDFWGNPQVAWTDSVACYPLQLLVVDTYSPLPDLRLSVRDLAGPGRIEFPLFSRVIYLGGGPEDEDYASAAEVTSLSDRGHPLLRVTRLDRRLWPLPSSLTGFLAEDMWLSLHRIADLLSLPNKVVSVLTSSIPIDKHVMRHSPRDIGLRLKFAHRNLVRLGFCQRKRHRVPQQTDLAHHFHLQSKREREGSSNGGPNAVPAPPATPFSAERFNGVPAKEEWLFSPAAVETIREYCSRFPAVIQTLCVSGTHTPNPWDFCIGPWAGRPAEEVVHAIADWVERQPCLQGPLVDAADDALPAPLLAELEELVTRSLEERSPPLLVPVEASRHEIFRPFTTLRDSSTLPVAAPPPTPHAISLLDRVVVVQPYGTVPFGAVGTVVRVLADGRAVEVLLDEPFWLATHLDGRLKRRRGLLLPAASLLRFDTVPYCTVLPGEPPLIHVPPAPVAPRTPQRRTPQEDRPPRPPSFQLRSPGEGTAVVSSHWDANGAAKPIVLLRARNQRDSPHQIIDIDPRSNAFRVSPSAASRWATPVDATGHELSQALRWSGGPPAAEPPRRPPPPRQPSPTAAYLYRSPAAGRPPEAGQVPITAMVVTSDPCVIHAKPTTPSTGDSIISCAGPASPGTTHPSPPFREGPFMEYANMFLFFVHRDALKRQERERARLAAGASHPGSPDGDEEEDGTGEDGYEGSSDVSPNDESGRAGDAPPPWLTQLSNGFPPRASSQSSPGLR
eukprot:EG_transcript_425